MIGLSIYVELAAAVVLILLAGRRKSRLAATVGIALFACALGTLSFVHVRSGSNRMAVLYILASLSQVYAAFRTWNRWPNKTTNEKSITGRR
jgi:hypothetical protein